MSARKSAYKYHKVFMHFDKQYTLTAHTQASEELDKLDTLSYAFNCWWVLLGINFYMPSGGGGFYGGKVI